MTDPSTWGGIDPATAARYPAAPPVAAPDATTDPATLHPPVGQWHLPDPAIPAPAPAGRAGGRGRPLLAGGVAVALLAGGTYATTRLLGSDRGAASPEQAGERLLAAVNDADVLGVIDLLPPGEQQLFLDLADEYTSEGRRLGVLGDTFRLDGFPGVDIEITDPELEVEDLGEGLAQVSLVDGEATVEIDGDIVAGTLGEVAVAIAEANDAEVEAAPAEEAVDIGEEVAAAADDGRASPFSVTVVEIDGRWFPSVGFTIAELARTGGAPAGDAVPDAPALGDGVEPRGAGSPEDAVQALLDAAASVDAEAAIEVLDPGEMGALQVYSELFLDELDPSGEGQVTAELTDADVTSLGDGVHRVVPTGIRVEGDFDDGSFLAELDEGCVTTSVEATDPDDDFDLEVCDDGDLSRSLTDALGDSFDDVEVPPELGDLVEAFQPIEVGIITVERDGQHFVSPLRTVFDLGAIAYRGLERDDLEEGGIVFELLTGGLDDEFGEFFDAVFDETFTFDEEVTTVDDEVDEPFVDAPVRTPTGPTGRGPAGELLLGDVVAGAFPIGGEASFALLGTAGEAFIGAQATDGGDLTITVTDAVTGAELDFNDDFVGLDPEAFAIVTEGQQLLVTVRAFGDAEAGDFVVYYEG